METESVLEGLGDVRRQHVKNDDQSSGKTDDESLADLDKMSVDSSEKECIALSDSDDDEVETLEVFESFTVAVGEQCRKCLAYGDRITIFDHHGGVEVLAKNKLSCQRSKTVRGSLGVVREGESLSVLMQGTCG